MRLKWVNDIHIIFSSIFFARRRINATIVLKVSVFFIPSFLSQRVLASGVKYPWRWKGEKMWIMIDLWAFFHCCNDAEKE